MFSEVALEAAPTVGNAHLGQRGSGHSVVSLAQHVPRHRAGIMRVGGRDEGAGKLCE